MTPSPELAILRHLAGRPPASAAEIGIAWRITAAEVRVHLVMLCSMRLMANQQDLDSAKLRRVYRVTAEGRRKAGIGDVRR